MELYRKWLVIAGLVLIGFGLLGLILTLRLGEDGRDELPLPEMAGSSAYAVWEGEVQLGAAASRLPDERHFLGGATVGETSYFVEANSMSLIEIPASGEIKVRRLALPEGQEPPEVGDLEATNNGTLLLSDIANGQVWQYTLDGRLLGSFFGPDADRSLVETPLGLGRDRLGNLLVTDVGDQKVKVFDREGDLITSWGGEGQAVGQFSFPNDVVADPSGRIFVSDSNNRRVQIFDAEGSFVRAFRETAQPEGLTLPRSLALDEQGRLHVADTLNGQVAVFSHEGQYLGSYGNLGPEEERLQYPEGLALSGSRILIGDRAKGRLSAFRLPI